MYQLFNQPLSISNVLRNSLSLYKASFVRLLPINIVFILVSFLSSYLISQVNFGRHSFSMQHFGFFFAINAIMYLIYLVMLKIVQQIMFHGRVSYNDALKIGIQKWFLCFSGKIVFTVTVLVGGLLLVLPGIYIFFSLSFLTLSILFSEAPLVDEIKQSIQFVADHWWRIIILLGIVLALGLGLLSVEKNILIPNVSLIDFLQDIGRSFHLVYTHWCIVSLGIILAGISSMSLSKAIKHSYQLVSHHWWATFVILGIFVWLLVIGFIALIMQFYRSDFLQTLMDSQVQRTVAIGVLQGLEMCIAVPWIIAVYLTQYHNLGCYLKQKEKV